MLLSVFIPSYNRGHKLEATIESVLSQPEGLYELIVADFEGWGISDIQRDAQFVKDFPGLIMKYVGLGRYLRYGIYLTRVSFYRFRHGVTELLLKAHVRD